MATDARHRMVTTMASLLRSQGLHATGLNQIVAESGSPKGSLYHYFPRGKEQLAAEATSMAGEQATNAFVRAFASHRTALAALRAVVAWMAQELERSDFRNGCPIATVALEANESEPIREACDGAYRDWQEAISTGLRAEGRSSRVAGDDAALIVAALEGALILSRTGRDTHPLRVFSRRLPTFLGHTQRPAAAR